MDLAGDLESASAMMFDFLEVHVMVKLWYRILSCNLTRREFSMAGRRLENMPTRGWW